MRFNSKSIVGQLHLLPHLAFLSLVQLYVLRAFVKIPLSEREDSILTTDQKEKTK